MGIRLRPAVAADYPSFERWFSMLESGDPTPSAQRWNDELVPCCTVAESNGHAVGYCLAQVFGSDGYVRHLVVDPSARRTGAGRLLLRAAMSTMRSAGCTGWRLNVRDDNAPALSLYASLGLEIHHGCTALRFAPSLVDTLPRSSRAAEVVEPDAKQIAVLERRFDLPVGQLDSSRVHPKRAVLGLLPEGSSSPGVATFDSVRQGSFPFRAGSMDGAYALLEILRSRSTGPHMGIVSEDIDAFTERLVGAGAQVTFRFVHMRGRL